MLSSKINKILLAENDLILRENLQERLRRLAPSATLQCTVSITETCEALEDWKPVLAVIDFTLNGGSILHQIRSRQPWYCAPFTLGITDCATCEDTAFVMRHGFSHVLDKPFPLEKFDCILQQIISEPAPLEFCINRIVNPLIYGNTDQLNLKRLSEDIELHIFTAASNVVQSKNGLARLLGISRQLVQYHLKKNGHND